MKTLPFTKMSAAGNDFIVVDGERLPRPARPARLARRLCPRAASIGADGLLVLRRLKGPIAARVDYYNADGTKTFCGNGTRAAAVWARSRNWGGKTMRLKTAAGVLPCELLGTRRARVRLRNPSPATRLRLLAAGRRFVVSALDTGVPHAVARVSHSALPALDVEKFGRALRRHRAFGSGGTNVNFTAVKNGVVCVRTYERGVEAETLACGTGIAAAAVASGLQSPVAVLTRAGARLRVSFMRDSSGVRALWLEGPAEIVYTGEILI